MFELTVEMTFSAAHQIEGHPGPCARLHGHNYRVLIAVAGSDLDQRGLLLDFGELKALCQEILAPLDHSHLNELPAFADINPTAEALARHICRAVSHKLADTEHRRLQVASVTVYESDRSFATYRE